MRHWIAPAMISLLAGAYVGYSNGFSKGLVASPQYARFSADRERVIQAEMAAIIADNPEHATCDQILSLAQRELERRYADEARVLDAVPID